MIPTYDEYENIFNLYTYFNNRVVKHMLNIEFIIVDDSPDRRIEEEITSKVGWMRYLRGSGNYGDSLVKGMLLSGNYDKLIIMDADHPHTQLVDMMLMLDKYDVVIGADESSNNERRVTKWLCNNLLGLNLKHPTCGFMGFNSYVTRLVDDRNIHFWFACSKYDIIHVEFIKECRNRNLNIGELVFNSNDLEHNYNMKRYARWIYDFIRLLLFGGFYD